MKPFLKFKRPEKVTVELFLTIKYEWSTSNTNGRFVTFRAKEVTMNEGILSVSYTHLTLPTKA